MPTVKQTQQTYPTLAPSPRLLTNLHYTYPAIIRLRDSAVVIYKRKNSPLYQCRYKLADENWHRLSTRQYALEHAVAVACDLYDEARYRQRLGLAHRAHTFAQIAKETLIKLRQQIDIARGRTAYESYVSCIEKYFLPYFAEKHLEEITHTNIVQFEAWRNRQMKRTPKASTLNNFAAAWNNIINTAIERGHISDRVAIPKLSTAGLKSKPRPAFSRAEIDYLLTYMQTWCAGGRVG